MKPMKTRTAAFGIAGIALVGLAAGLCFFSSDEAVRAPVAPTASAAAARARRGATTASALTPAPRERAGAPRATAEVVEVAEVAEAAGGRAGQRAQGRRPVPARKVAPTAPQVAKLRASLTSAEAQERLVAVRYLRTVDATELLHDVRALLQTETVTPVRRVASQLLAQLDPGQSLDALSRLREDPDAVVRINAAYGLARAGDVSQQEWLLGVYDAARVASPRLVPAIAAALEDPAMKSPAVVARFRAVADDPRQAPALRAKAAQVLRAKLEG